MSDRMIQGLYSLDNLLDGSKMLIQITYKVLISIIILTGICLKDKKLCIDQNHSNPYVTLDLRRVIVFCVTFRFT